MWSTLQRLASGVRDVVTPARCIGCLTEGTWHCSTCLSQQLRPPILNCIVCSKETPRGLTCRDCRSESLLHGSISIAPYQAVWAQRAIHWLKFKGIRNVAKPLALLLSQHLTTIASLETLQKEALLIPIPLHASRLRDRGFNQSEDLALEMSRITGIQTLNVLSRTRATHVQSHLPPSLRSENLKDAFSITTPISPSIKFCLLVDDVVTTGATLEAAAEVLPTHVERWVCTVARG